MAMDEPSVEQLRIVCLAIADARQEVKRQITRIKGPGARSYAKRIKENLDVILSDIEERFEITEWE